MSVQEELGLYGTRIIGFGVSDTRPAVGQDVTVTGTLQMHWPVVCIWEGVGAETVRILADDQELGTALTRGDGVFHFVWRPTTVGEFLVKAFYPGSWRFDPCESQSVRVTVLSEEEKEAETMRFWLLVGGVAVVGVVAIGGVAWWYEESRRRELMLAALARR